MYNTRYVRIFTALQYRRTICHHCLKVMDILNVHTANSAWYRPPYFYLMCILNSATMQIILIPTTRNRHDQLTCEKFVSDGIIILEGKAPPSPPCSLHSKHANYVGHGSTRGLPKVNVCTEPPT